MLIIQYLIIFIFVQTCDLFVLLNSPLKYNEDIRSINSYYTIKNSSLSASLIDYMRTLYEQEKINNKQFDYNLIRGLAPRIGKKFSSFYEFNLCHIRLNLKMLSAF
jgi:hypothetical protein